MQNAVELLEATPRQLTVRPARASGKSRDPPQRGRCPDGEWAQSDLNRRPPGYQPGAPANLSYGPRRQGKRHNLSLSWRITEVDLSRQLDSLAERLTSVRSSTEQRTKPLPTTSAPGRPGAFYPIDKAARLCIQLCKSSGKLSTTLIERARRSSPHKGLGEAPCE